MWPNFKLIYIFESIRTHKSIMRSHKLLNKKFPHAFCGNAWLPSTWVYNLKNLKLNELVVIFYTEFDWEKLFCQKLDFSSQILSTPSEK